MTETETREGRFDVLSSEFLADPYAFYALLREGGRIHWHEPMNAWIVPGHADIVEVLRDDRMSADRRNSDNFQGTATEAEELPRSMLSSDPPDHTRLRKLVNRAFTARRVRSLEDRITGIVDDLLDAVADRGEMDVIADFAYPLPITVIAEMLGVPPEDRDRFRRWSEPIAIALGPLTPPDREAEAAEARDHLVGYFSEMLEVRRREPANDLITALVSAEEEGDKLTHGELLAMLLLLLIAGHETTVNLIGNGLNALLHHPDQLERLRGNPELDGTAVEEFLRYDSPVQLTGRVAMEPTEVAGQEVVPHQSVVTLLGSANRDAEVFDDPDVLDIGREENPHLSFSAGIHYCLGAQLARLEAKVAVPTLVRRFPDLELATDDLRYRPAVVLRGLEELPVRF